MSERSAEDTTRFAQLVANKQGWKVNFEDELTADILSGLQANHQRYGYFLCPCRDGSGNREEDRDIICPCVYAAQDIKEHGHCFCGLFLSEAFFVSGKEAESIPERRNQ